MILIPTQEEAQHLAAALSVHMRDFQRNGRHLPPGLSAYLEAFVALSGQERTTFGDSGNSLDSLAMSIERAAAVLGVSVRTVRRLVAAGRLASFRAGRRRLILATEVARFVEAGAA